MRLWHQKLIKYLPSKKDFKGCSNQLGGQWTEIRMILGSIRKKGKVNHSTVNYVNDYPISYLYAYGLLVADEMINRNFNVSKDIINEYLNDKLAFEIYDFSKENNLIIYPEHNKRYLKECIDNLKTKNVKFYKDINELC